MAFVLPVSTWASNQGNIGVVQTQNYVCHGHCYPIWCWVTDQCHVLEGLYIEVVLNKLIQTVHGIDSTGVGENAEVIHGRVKVPEPSLYLILQDEAARRVDLVPDGLTIVYTVYEASEGSLPIIQG